jgi:hypothetical protein
LCACGVLFCVYSIRMFYARLKICVMSVFCWCAESPDSPEIFPGVSGFPGHSGFSPDSPDLQLQISFSSLIECIICHEHLTIISCTSQAPHLCNTLMLLSFVQNLALKGPLIYKIKMHILRGSITKVLIFIVYLL